MEINVVLYLQKLLFFVFFAKEVNMVAIFVDIFLADTKCCNFWWFLVEDNSKKKQQQQQNKQNCISVSRAREGFFKLRLSGITL